MGRYSVGLAQNCLAARRRGVVACARNGGDGSHFVTEMVASGRYRMSERISKEKKEKK